MNDGVEYTVDLNGREITLAIGETVDEYGQFRVAVAVDGKERWEAWFTDKSEEAKCPK